GSDQPREVDRPADAEDLRHEQPGFVGVPPAAASSLDRRHAEVIWNEAGDGPLPRALLGGAAELLHDRHRRERDHRPLDEVPQAVYPVTVPEVGISTHRSSRGSGDRVEVLSRALWRASDPTDTPFMSFVMMLSIVLIGVAAAAAAVVALLLPEGRALQA